MARPICLELRQKKAAAVLILEVSEDTVWGSQADIILDKLNPG